ncbi:MAPEG family protein [Dyella sp.]|jgi:glutathione S-transferase|uniref:MAPEG family protein n=1 Tax=Dyella sp. TaxID=1869338 RepID=UPI002D7A39A5|nr:MAPEG family protein [Dyella sp.]HET6433694.1 MAPEG family protein [Dyella sp.]
MLQQLPALVTLLNVLLLSATVFAVGRARGRYGIKAPATSGHEGFERAYRVQMNTIEQTVLFLPTLWLAANYGFAGWAGLAGLVWIVGRVWYFAAYLRDPASRGGGFVTGMVAWLVMLVLASIGVVRALLLS